MLKKRFIFIFTHNSIQVYTSLYILYVFEKYDHTAAVIEEAKQNAQNFKFSSMLCMFALSAVIGCAIESYYPITNDSALKEDWDSLAKMFNCSVYPREFSNGELLESVHILHCTVMPKRYLIDRSIPMAKNHFVQLVILSLESTTSL